MILSKNTDVKAVIVKSIEGKAMYGGDLMVKPLIKGDEMTFLEIHYTPGVGAPLHVHSHESLAYVVKGKVKMTVERKSENDRGRRRIHPWSGRCLPASEGCAAWRRGNRGIDRGGDQIPRSRHLELSRNVTEF